MFSLGKVSALFSQICYGKNYKMINCIKHRVINILSFSEKAGRLDYFCVWIGSLIFPLVLSVILNYILEDSSMRQYLPIFTIFLIMLLNLANASRRVNDLEKPPAFVLLIFVPVVQLAFILYLMSAAGKTNSNLIK